MEENYSILKDKVIEMNNLNDEIDLIRWNNDEGPKFDSVKELKDFIRSFEDGDLNYIFGDISTNKKNNISKDVFIESYKHTKDNIFFFLFTFKKNNEYTTYLSLKKLDQNDMINNLCGKQDKDKKSAHFYFETLKDIVISNSIEEILVNLIIDVTKTIEKLKYELKELTGES